MLTVEDVGEILSIPLLGVIPESESVLRASNTGTPVVFDDDSPAGRAYLDAVARFLGEAARDALRQARAPQPVPRLVRQGVMGLFELSLPAAPSQRGDRQGAAADRAGA